MKNLKTTMIILLLVTAVVFGQRKEMEEKRTFYSKSFRNQDNTITTEISMSPVHFVDDNNQLQTINRNFVPSTSEGFDFEVTSGLYHVYLKSDLTSDYPVVFETKDGANLKMKMQGMVLYDDKAGSYQVLQTAQSVEPVVKDNEIVFPGVCNDIDVKYVYNDLRLKEEIFVSDKARQALPKPESYGIKSKDAYLMFLFQLDMDGSLEPSVHGKKIKKQNHAGAEKINFKNLKGDVKFFLPVDWAFLDAERNSIDGAQMHKLQKRIIHNKDGHFLLTGMALDQLNEMKPGTVVFDPQVEITFQPDATQGKDTQIYYKEGPYSYDDYNYGIKTQMNVGRSRYGEFHRYRTLIYFDVSFIPSTAAIQSAALKLYSNYDYASAASDIDVHKLLKSWDEGEQDNTTGEASWNNRKYGILWAGAGGTSGVDYASSVSATLNENTRPYAPEWFEWNITSLVEDWIADPQENYGALLKYKYDATPDATYNHLFRFASSDNATVSQRPVLSITYTDHFTTTFYVRDASGQVIATYKK